MLLRKIPFSVDFGSDWPLYGTLKKSWLKINMLLTVLSVRADWCDGAFCLTWSCSISMHSYLSCCSVLPASSTLPTATTSWTPCSTTPLVYAHHLLLLDWLARHIDTHDYVHVHAWALQGHDDRHGTQSLERCTLAAGQLVPTVSRSNSPPPRPHPTPLFRHAPPHIAYMHAARGEGRRGRPRCACPVLVVVMRHSEASIMASERRTTKRRRRRRRRWSAKPRGCCCCFRVLWTYFRRDFFSPPYLTFFLQHRPSFIF